MAIARFEQIIVKNLAFAKSDFGEQTTAQTEWFKTRARVSIRFQQFKDFGKVPFVSRCS
jgi:hypothetical protein